MQKENNLKLNIFQIDLEELGLPSEIYVYKISPKTTNSKDLIRVCKRLENTYGYFDNEEWKLFSFKEIDFVPKRIKDKVDILFEGSIEFNTNLKGIERLLKTYIRAKIKHDIKSLIKNLKHEFLHENTTIGKWNLSLELDKLNIEIVNDNFYTAFTIKLRILANKNLWDFVGRDKEKLKTLCWDYDKVKDNKIWFRYAPDIKDFESNSYILVDVKDKNELRKGLELDFEQLKCYPIDERGLTREELEELARFKSFDENQPIIKGQKNINAEPLSFLPQYCIPSYSPLLATKEEINKVERVKNNIMFHKKHYIIKQIVNELNYLKLNYQDLEIKNLTEGKLKASFVKVKVSLNRQKKQNIVVEVEGKPYTKTITNTADLFSWIHKLENLTPEEKLEVEVPIPEYIPESIKNLREIPVFILLESKNNRKIIESILKWLLKRLWQAYVIIRKASNYAIPALKLIENPQNKNTVFEFQSDETGIRDIVNTINNILNLQKKELGFAFIFGDKQEIRIDDEEIEEFDYYIPLKRFLFENNILSQNFLVSSYTDKKGNIDEKKLKFSLSNIIYNFFGKLGVKFFALEEKVPYDFILGIDTGYSEAYTGRVAGCTTIHDSEGRLRNIIPIEKLNPAHRESARVKALMEEIEIKMGISFSGKRILILRDGKIQNSELEQLKKFVESRNCILTIIGIRKNTAYQWLDKDDKEHISVKIGGFWLLKAHNPRRGFPNLVKITEKVEITKDHVYSMDITEDDVNLVYKLTFLNYSVIGNPSNLKIPAPVYYADKLVKALKRGWKLDSKLLKQGVLYFL